MHFNIVEISTTHVPARQTRRELAVYEDTLLLSRSDWFGLPVDDYPGALENIQHAIRPIASVNLKRRTLRFHSKKAVARTYARHLNEAHRKHNADLRKGVCRHWELRRCVDDICGIDDLFYNGYCQTAGGLVEDYLNGHLPRILHIGTIIDAHS